jgi:hypothetical protein
LPTPGSPSTAIHSPDRYACSISSQARSHSGEEPTRPGSWVRGVAAGAVVGSEAAWGTILTWTTPPPELPVTGRSVIRAVAPVGS